MDSRLWGRLIWFTVIAYGFSWLFWVPQALIAQEVATFPQPVEDFLFGPWNPAAWGPLVAALVMVAIEGGWRGVGDLLKKGIKGFSPIWLVPILLLFPAITLVAMLLASLLHGAEADFSAFADPVALLGAALFMVFLSGPLQEEFGWRGFALERLQTRTSALTASIIIGVVWAVWHFPLNFANAEAGPQYSEVAAMVIGSIITITIISILFTWVYNNTGGSVLAVILLHGSMNLATFHMFPVFEVENMDALPYYSAGIVIAAVLVITYFKPQRLMRARG